VFLPDDLWRLFGLDGGPGAIWLAAEPVIVLVLPAAVLLAAVVLSALTGEG
jgi:hypothetical protein